LIVSGQSLAKKEEEAAPPRVPTQAEATMLMAYARELRETQGCAKAIPSYRVVAAMGEGLEAAQHELGECLLMAPSTSEVEAKLLREEALFWLKRAAFAGNARAQRSLSFFYGAGNSAQPSNEEALKWALLYQANGESEVYGFKELPPTYVPGLKQALSAEEIAAAEAFAGAFKPIHLPPYKAPPRPKGKKGEPPPGSLSKEKRDGPY
jgi:TPR repeat protein